MIKSFLEQFHNAWSYHNYSVGADFVVEDGGSFYRIIVSNTCDWVIRGNGCAMCNYSSRDGKHASENITRNKEKIFEQVSLLNKSYKKIKLYINGSFFNENELKYDIGFEFINDLIRLFRINEISVESRSEYVRHEIVKKYIDALGISFEICFGLETTNDSVRQYCMNKGSSINDFLRALNEVRSLCKIKVYLLIKPPFLSDIEAINDVVNSVEFLVKNGINNISYTPVAVQENTILQFLLAESLYRPVWIWSIIEINERLTKYFHKDDFRIKLSGLSYYPQPLATLFNCEKCSEILIDSLFTNPYLTWGDLNDFSCDCILDWKEEIASVDKSSFSERISLASEILNKNKLRSEQIASRVAAPVKTALITDVAKLIPNYKVILDKVGISELEIPLTINGFCPCIAQVNLSIALDEFHRGVHMSRLIEAMYEFGKATHNDLIVDSQTFLSFIIKNNKETNFVSFNLKATLMKENKTILSKKIGFTSMEIDIKISQKRTVCTNLVSIEIPIINCCPCTLITSQDIFHDKFSHTQKGKIILAISIDDLKFDEIIKIFNEYVMINDLLKREDEVFIVKSIFELPLFCEDICRKMSIILIEKFSERKGEIVITVTTEESIHPHKAYAEKTLKFGGYTNGNT